MQTQSSHGSYGYSNLLSTQHTEHDTKEWIEWTPLPSPLWQRAGKSRIFGIDWLCLWDPGKFTWNPNMEVWKMTFLFGVVFGNYSDSPNSRPVWMVFGAFPRWGVQVCGVALFKFRCLSRRGTPGGCGCEAQPFPLGWSQQLVVFFFFFGCC